MSGSIQVHELEADDITILYSVRFSRRARRRRIVVRPGHVEIVAPVGDSEKALHRIMSDRRQWISGKLRSLKEKDRRLTELTSYELLDGGSIPYRGRRLSLRIHPSAGRDIRIVYRSGFHVHRPPGTQDEDLRESMDRWLRKRLEADIQPLILQYSTELAVKPCRVAIRDMKTRWGSCSSRGNLSFNLRLIHLPRSMTEYVVAHELCHLLHRDHSRRFWELLDSVLPQHIPRARRLEPHFS